MSVKLSRNKDGGTCNEDRMVDNVLCCLARKFTFFTYSTTG